MKKLIKNDLNEALGQMDTVGQSHESLLGDASGRLTAENREKVIDYAVWLAAEDTHNNSISSHEETSEYIDAAMQNSIIKGRVVRIFAPFHYDTSALGTFTFGQRIFFLLLFFALWFALILLREET